MSGVDAEFDRRCRLAGLDPDKVREFIASDEDVIQRKLARSLVNEFVNDATPTLEIARAASILRAALLMLDELVIDRQDRERRARQGV